MALVKGLIQKIGEAGIEHAIPGLVIWGVIHCTTAAPHVLGK